MPKETNVEAEKSASFFHVKRNMKYVKYVYFSLKWHIYAENRELTTDNEVNWSHPILMTGRLFFSDVCFVLSQPLNVVMTVNSDKVTVMNLLIFPIKFFPAQQ